MMFVSSLSANASFDSNVPERCQKGAGSALQDLLRFLYPLNNEDDQYVNMINNSNRSQKKQKIKPNLRQLIEMTQLCLSPVMENVSSRMDLQTSRSKSNVSGRSPLAGLLIRAPAESKLMCFRWQC